MGSYIKILLATMMFLLGSCGGGNGENYTDVIFTDVLCPKQFYSSAQNDSMTFVVNSSEELMAIVNSLELPGVEIPNLNYSLGSLAIVYGGYRGTTNEWVAISGISKAENGAITVNYNDFSAGFPDCGGDGAISYSICIVQADRHFTEANFEHQTLNSCEAEENRP